MKFFDREREIELLRNIERRSHDVAQFTVVTGRRRVGKTSLVLKAVENAKSAYLFVDRMSEKDLCEIFKHELEAQLGLIIHGTPERFTEVFEEILKYAYEHPISVIIDEFQEFRKINMSVFSGMQKLWDLNKGKARINLIVTGSVYTLMQKIFKTRKAALYGRETAFMKIDPFRVSVVKDILKSYSPHYKPEDLLALWTFTGGVAKYVELLMDGGAYTRDAMIDLMIREDSPFLEEGRAVLVEEFDKEYGVYFSILAAIAQGRNTRSELTQAIGRDVGGYLVRLEDDYALINRKLPLFARATAKGAHFQLNDSFFRFWFRFVFKFGFLLEIKGYDRLREIIRRDYPVFSGLALESYFREKFIESGEWTRLGNWWDRKGENEIDLVAENELDGRFVVAEVKRVKKRLDLVGLARKYKTFAAAAGLKKSLRPEFIGLSMEDM